MPAFAGMTGKMDWRRITDQVLGSMERGMIGW
jgi:hypothetical protein